MERKGIATAILVFSPPYAVVVKDESKKPAFWKLPGGTLKPGDRGEASNVALLRPISGTERNLLETRCVDSETLNTAVACGMRELLEETHILLQPAEVALLEIQDRGKHWMFLFAAVVKNVYERGFDKTKRGNEGEIVTLFDQRDPRESLVSAVDFFSPHRKLIEHHAARDNLQRLLRAAA